MNERIEKVNKLLNIFCKDQLQDEYLSKKWVTNLKLVKAYSDELVKLVGDLE